MRLGFALPQYGPVGTPENVLSVATRAEDLGYDGLWVSDRILSPVAPRAPYPASADGKLPEGAKRVLDPLELLAFVAARTERVALGTSVVNLPFQPPVILARRLATIDVLSGGRVRAGFGQGWSPDEYEAVGAPMEGRGRRMDEAIAVIKAMWGPDPVSYEGRYHRVAASHAGPKPVQKPHPPIYLAAYTPASMKRVAREADGWNPAGVPVEGMRAMYAQIREMAEAAGRDPGALELVVRANVHVTAAPLGDGRPVFCGTRDQIAADVSATRALDPHEIFFDTQIGHAATSAEPLLADLEWIREMVAAG